MLRDKTDEHDFKTKPLEYNPTRQEIFFYAPQRIAVQEILKPFMAPGRVVLVPVDEHNINRIRGLEDITFVVLTRHPQGLPSTLQEALAVQGSIIWHIDDINARRRYGSNYQARGR